MFKNSVEKGFWAMVFGLVALCFGFGGCGIEQPSKKPELKIEVERDWGMWGLQFVMHYPQDKHPPTLELAPQSDATILGRKADFLTGPVWDGGGPGRLVRSGFRTDMPHLPAYARVVVTANAAWAEGPVSYGYNIPGVYDHFRTLLQGRRIEADCVTDPDGTPTVNNGITLELEENVRDLNKAVFTARRGTNVFWAKFEVVDESGVKTPSYFEGKIGDLKLTCQLGRLA